jgi:hypothetical protein
MTLDGLSRTSGGIGCCYHAEKQLREFVRLADEQPIPDKAFDGAHGIDLFWARRTNDGAARLVCANELAWFGHDQVSLQRLGLVAGEIGEGDRGVQERVRERQRRGISSDVAAGRYKAKPTRVFRFEDIREAHRAMKSNQAKGKMVVVL